MKNKYTLKTKRCYLCKKEYSPTSSAQKFCEDCRMKTCIICKSKYNANNKLDSIEKSQYCSRDCYIKGRWGIFQRCKMCHQIIGVGYSRYCSKKCQRNYWNKNDPYLIKKKRMWLRKIEIIKTLGGKCKKCGNDDIRVLEINHRNKDKKEKPRNLKYNLSTRLREWEKNLWNLELLCANCHRIVTWDQMKYGNKGEYIDLAYKRIKPYLSQQKLVGGE